MHAVSWETPERLAAKSHAKHTVLRWKDGKSYSCPPQHTAPQHIYTRYLCTAHCTFIVFSRYSWGLSLNMSRDTSRKGNSCGLCVHVCACACVCVFWDDITRSMTSTWQQREGRDIRGWTHEPQYLMMFWVLWVFFKPQIPLRENILKGKRNSKTTNILNIIIDHKTHISFQTLSARRLRLVWLD